MSLDDLLHLACLLKFFLDSAALLGEARQPCIPAFLDAACLGYHARHQLVPAADLVLETQSPLHPLELPAKAS